jgi:hypothetical protein
LEKKVTDNILNEDKVSNRIEKDEKALLLDEEFEALFGHKEEFDESIDVEFIQFDDYVALKKSGLLISVGNNIETVITKGFNIATPAFIQAEEEYFFGKSRSEIIKRILRLFSYEKIYILTGAIRKGIDLQTIIEVTAANKLFVQGLKNIVILEEYLKSYNLEQVPTELLLRSKSFGITDEGIAYLLNCEEHEVAHKIRSNSILSKFTKFNSVKVGLPYDEEYYFSMYVDKKQFVDVSEIVDITGTESVGDTVELTDIVDAKDIADIIESSNLNEETESIQEDTESNSCEGPLSKNGVVFIKNDSICENPKVIVLCDDSKKIDKEFLERMFEKYRIIFISNVTINKSEIQSDVEHNPEYKIYFEQLIFENVKNIFEFEKADKTIIILGEQNRNYFVPRIKITGIDIIENANSKDTDI